MPSPYWPKKTGVGVALRGVKVTPASEETAPDFSLLVEMSFAIQAHIVKEVHLPVDLYTRPPEM